MDKLLKEISGKSTFDDGLAQDALYVIERLALEEDPNCESAAMSKIYRVAHTVNSIECRKNHGAWLAELKELVRAFA